MKFKVLAISLAAFFAMAAGASAHTTIVEPPGSHFPYQRWVDESLVPTPDVTIEVLEVVGEDGCPDRELRYEGCTSPVEHKIWLSVEDLVAEGFPRKTFMHEVGHNFDADVMPEWARARFDEIYDLGGPWAVNGEPQPLSPSEYFAEAYSECAVKPYVAKNEWSGAVLPVYGRRPIFERRVAHNKVCRMLGNL